MKMNFKNLLRALLECMSDLIVFIVGYSIKSLLIASKWLKKAFNIETALYSWWWEMHSKNMQRALNKAHQTNY